MSPSNATHCTYCQRSFQSILEKKVHEQHVHVFVFKCDFCETKFASERNLSKHISKCNEKPKPTSKGPVKLGDKIKTGERYTERKRKASIQVEEYAELLKDMKHKAARKELLVIDSSSSESSYSENRLKKQFLEKILQEAKEVAQSKGNKKLVDKFEGLRAKNNSLTVQDNSESAILSVGNEKAIMKKKTAKAVVAFECSFCDSLFKSKEALVVHEAGHESQDNSDGDNDAQALPSSNSDIPDINLLIFEDAKRKANLLPEIQKREEMLNEKLDKLKQIVLSKQRAEHKQRRIEIVQAAMKKKQLQKGNSAIENVMEKKQIPEQKAASEADLKQNQSLQEKLEKNKSIANFKAIPQNQSSSRCTKYEYQKMLEKANGLDTVQKEHHRLQLKLERVKKHALLKQQEEITDVSKPTDGLKMGPVEVFNEAGKSSIKMEPTSPDKFEEHEMDPNFQVKLEPDISIKEEPEEYVPETPNFDSIKRSTPNVAEKFQEEQREKYKALKARLEQLKAQKELENKKKPKTVVQKMTSNDPSEKDTEIKTEAAVEGENSVLAKRLKARKAREDTVREIHKRIEERNRVKEEEETKRRQEIDKIKEEEDIALRELKSQELLDDLRQEVEKVSQEVEAKDTKHRKKSRKELRKHLQDKMVVTGNEESSDIVSKELKLEKIKEMENEREKLQQRLQELKLKRGSVLEKKHSLINTEKKEATVYSESPDSPVSNDNTDLAAGISYKELEKNTFECVLKVPKLTAKADLVETVETKNENVTHISQITSDVNMKQINKIKVSSQFLHSDEASNPALANILPTSNGDNYDQSLLDFEAIKTNSSEFLVDQKITKLNIIGEQTSFSDEDSDVTDAEENALDISYDEIHSDDDDANDALEVTGEDDETKQWRSVAVKEELNWGEGLKSVKKEVDKEIIATCPIVIDNIIVSDDEDEEDDPELEQYISYRFKTSLSRSSECESKFDPDVSAVDEDEEDEDGLNDVEEINDKHVAQVKDMSNCAQVLIEVDVLLSEDGKAEEGQQNFDKSQTIFSENRKVPENELLLVEQEVSVKNKEVSLNECEFRIPFVETALHVTNIALAYNNLYEKAPVLERSSTSPIDNFASVKDEALMFEGKYDKEMVLVKKEDSKQNLSITNSEEENLLISNLDKKVHVVMETLLILPLEESTATLQKEGESTATLQKEDTSVLKQNDETETAVAIQQKINAVNINQEEREIHLHQVETKITNHQEVAGTLIQNDLVSMHKEEVNFQQKEIKEIIQQENTTVIMNQEKTLDQEVGVVTMHQWQSEFTKQQKESADTIHQEKAVFPMHPEKAAENMHQINAEATIHQEESEATMHLRESVFTMHNGEAEVDTMHQESPFTNHQEKLSSTPQQKETAVTIQHMKTAVTIQHEKTAVTIQHEKTAVIIQQEETAVTMHHQENATTIQQEETAVAIQQEETAVTIQQEETAVTIQQEETEVTIQQEETAVTIQQEKTAVTIQQGETAVTIQQGETAVTMHQEEYLFTRHQVEPASTIQQMKPASTIQKIKSASTIQQIKPASTIPQEETEVTIQQEENAVTIQLEENAVTIQQMKPASTIPQVETEVTIQQEENAVTIQLEENAVTIQQGDTAVTIHQEESAVTMHQEEDLVTMHQVETADTIHQEEAAVTIQQKETAVTIQQEETAVTIQQEETAITIQQENTAGNIKQEETALTTSTNQHEENVFIMHQEENIVALQEFASDTMIQKKAEVIISEEEAGGRRSQDIAATIFPREDAEDSIGQEDVIEPTSLKPDEIIQEAAVTIILEKAPLSVHEYEAAVIINQDEVSFTMHQEEVSVTKSKDLSVYTMQQEKDSVIQQQKGVLITMQNHVEEKPIYQEDDICVIDNEVDAGTSHQEKMSGPIHQSEYAGPMHQKEYAGTICQMEDATAMQKVENTDTMQHEEDACTMYQEVDADAMNHELDADTMFHGEDADIMHRVEDDETVNMEEGASTMRPEDVCPTDQKDYDAGTMHLEGDVNTMNQEKDMGTMHQEEDVNNMHQDENMGTMHMEKNACTMQTGENAIVIQQNEAAMIHRNDFSDDCKDLEADNALQKDNGKVKDPQDPDSYSEDETSDMDSESTDEESNALDISYDYQSDGETINDEFAVDQNQLLEQVYKRRLNDNELKPFNQGFDKTSADDGTQLSVDEMVDDDKESYANLVDDDNKSNADENDESYVDDGDDEEGFGDENEWDEEYEEDWEDKTNSESEKKTTVITNSKEQIDENTYSSNQDISGSESEDDDEEWISLDTAQTILAVTTDDNELRKEVEIEVLEEKVNNDKKTESYYSESNRLTDLSSSSDSATNSSASESETEVPAVITSDKESADVIEEVNLSEDEEMDTEDCPNEFLEDAEDILDPTWKDANKFENIFSNDENGEEVLQCFYSGSLLKEQLRTSLPSMGWIGKVDAKFLPTGWFMKMNNKSLAYTFITDELDIHESSAAAIQFMQERKYRGDILEDFKEHCTYFDVTSSLFEEGDKNKEELDDSDYFMDDENVDETKTLDSHDQETNEDEQRIPRFEEGNQVKVEDNSFDDILSDSDEDFGNESD